jgi:hypothetical protein
MDRGSPSLVGRGTANSTRKSKKLEEVVREKSAGSGNLVLSLVNNISNPRVLSDMGLAIPL